MYHRLCAVRSARCAVSAKAATLRKLRSLRNANDQPTHFRCHGDSRNCVFVFTNIGIWWTFATLGSNVSLPYLTLVNIKRVPLMRFNFEFHTKWNIEPNKLTTNYKGVERLRRGSGLTLITGKYISNAITTTRKSGTLWNWSTKSTLQGLCWVTCKMYSMSDFKITHHIARDESLTIQSALTSIELARGLAATNATARHFYNRASSPLWERK